jgi:hypothetical protein
MRPDSIQAMANAAARAAPMTSAAQPRRETTAATPISVGNPTNTRHGTESAVAMPVIRSTPSGQTATSLAPFAAMARVTIGQLLRSRATHFALSTLWAMTMPF